MEEKIIFEADVSSLVERVQRSKVVLENYRDAMDEAVKATGKLSEESIASKAAFDAQNKSVKQSEGALLRLTQAEQALGGSLKDIVKTYDASSKSVEQNRKVLNALTAEYNKAGAAGRENLAPSIKKISDELKKQEGAIGDTRRNVGNYAASFKDAFSTIAAGIPGIQGFKNAQLGVNSAMNANPIGAVVLLLSSLFEIFSKNKKVADQVSFAIAGVTKALSSIIDTVVETVTNFDKLKTAILNPFKFFSDLGKGAAVAAKEGYSASKALDTLTVSSAILNAEIKRNQSQIDALTKSLKDRTKTEQERIKIANTIADLEIKNGKKVQESAAETLRIEQLKTKGLTLSGEQQAKLIELKSNVQQAADEANIVSAQRQTRINILLEKENTKATKEEAKNRVDLKREELKTIDEILKKESEQRAKDFEDETQRELAALVRREELIAQKTGDIGAMVGVEAMRRTLLLQNEKLTETERANIITESEIKISKIRQEARDKDLEESKKTVDKKAKLEKDQVAATTAIISEGLNVLGAISTILNTDIEAKQDKLKEALESGAINQKQYAAQTTELRKKQFEQNKAIALTSAILQGVNATLAAYTSGSAIPIVGAVTGPVFAALAAAFSAIQIGLIAAQQPPKFTKGVIGLNGEGDETSDSIPALLSKNESVVSARATHRYHKQLAMMEMSVGNTPNYQYGGGRFAGGFIPNISGDGGFTARETMRSSDNNLMIREAIKSGFQSAPAPVLSIVELENKQTSRNRSIAVSEI